MSVDEEDETLAEPPAPEPMWTDDNLPFPIDWEAKWHKLLSQKIRQQEAASRKLSEKDLELDTARRDIRDLQAKVRELTPAGEKLKKSEADAQKAAEEWAKRLGEANNRIAALNTKLAQGQRGRMEDVIAWMRRQADRLPAPDPEEEIELAPEPFVVSD